MSKKPTVLEKESDITANTATINTTTGSTSSIPEYSDENTAAPESSSATGSSESASTGSTNTPVALPMRIGSKRLFIGLVCGVSFLACLILLIGWGIPYIGLSNIHPSVPYITGGIILAIVLLIGWGAFGLVLQVLTGRTIFGTGKIRALAIKIFLPVSELIGRAVGIAPQDIRGSFIQVNNDTVLKGHQTFDPDKILLLLPHCIQWSNCPIRITTDFKRCKRCGRCNIGALLDLTERYGIHMAVATGGTLARRIVVELRPKMIIAVACERDLSSGIQDTYPLSVYGVLNERPFGPCKDTRVSLPRVE
ncbi:DUF116 domain-containing protein, partial [Desulfovibrio sp. OttesenSCG-928-F07]|nr:DUF116 domain-containing protein [Desulfovibrio sp. OttesenSCG-928-F07]